MRLIAPLLTGSFIPQNFMGPLLCRRPCVSSEDTGRAGHHHIPFVLVSGMGWKDVLDASGATSMGLSSQEAGRAPA